MKQEFSSRRVSCLTTRWIHDGVAGPSALQCGRRAHNRWRRITGILRTETQTKAEGATHFWPQISPENENRFIKPLLSQPHYRRCVLSKKSVHQSGKTVRNFPMLIAGVDDH